MAGDNIDEETARGATTLGASGTVGEPLSRMRWLRLVHAPGLRGAAVIPLVSLAGC